MILQEIRRYFNPTTDEHIDLAVLEVPTIKTAVEETGTPHLVFAVYTRYRANGEGVDFPEIMELGDAATKLTYTFGQESGWSRVDEDAPPTGELPDPLASDSNIVGMETLDDVELPSADDINPPKANRGLLDEAEQHFFGADEAAD